MDPLTMGLITGGAGLLGSIFSSQTSAANSAQQIEAQERMQQQTQQFNAEQADIQRGYETQMSNTAYQRASADMKAAGLNPMMMFGSGSSASTPSVGAASVGTPSVPMSQKTSPLGNLGQSVGSGLQAAVTAKTMDKMSDEMANLVTENDLLKKRADYTSALTGKTVQQQIIDSPDATKANLLERALSAHPDLTTAAEVTRYGGSAVGAATSAVGGLVGLGGRISSAIEDLGQGFSNSAKSKLRNTYTLPQARQRMKELEGSFTGE